MRDRQKSRDLRFVHRQGRDDRRPIKPSLLQMTGKNRSLDEAEVFALTIFLSLRDDQFSVAQVPDQRANLLPQMLGRADPAVTVSHLVAPRLVRAKAHKNRHLLAMRSDTLHEGNKKIILI